MVKNLFNKSFKRIIAVSILIIIILNIFSPYRAYASSYDDLKNILIELDNEDILDTIITELNVLEPGRQPSRSEYGDEYYDATTK